MPFRQARDCRYNGLGSVCLCELGLADALRKPVLVIAAKPLNFLGDFAGHKVVTYGPQESEKLSHFLQYWLRDTLEQSVSQSQPSSYPAQVTL